MTQKQIIEQIQQVHPEIGETQLRIMLNNALDEFVSEARTNVHMDTVTSSPTADKRYYDFTDISGISDAEDVLEVIQVTYGNSTDGEKIVSHLSSDIEPLDVT
tara:strand:- start:3828 stop:4136 length:309 start_codon:yes stop_codon:yes gene_type:complete